MEKKADGKKVPPMQGISAEAQHNIQSSRVSIKEAVSVQAGKTRHSQITQAIDHVAGQRKGTGALDSSPGASGRQIHSRSVSTQPNKMDVKYQKEDKGAAGPSASVKTEHELGAAREPLSPARQALEDITGPAAIPAPQTLEGQTADVAAAYQRAANPSPKDEPASFYANAGRPAGLPGDDGRMQGQGFRDEDSNPLNSYANKEVYQHRTDASTGQRLAAMGNEELSLTGRIQKMYQMH